MALEQRCHWLEGTEQPFLVWTNHKNLEYFGSAKRSSLTGSTFTSPTKLAAKMLNLTLSHVHSTKVDEEELSYILPQTCIVWAVLWEIKEKI